MCNGNLIWIGYMVAHALLGTPRVKPFQRKIEYVKRSEEELAGAIAAIQPLMARSFSVNLNKKGK